jgi:hypothetical protein
MTRLSCFAAVVIAVLLSAASLAGQQAFSVVPTVDAPSIAGRPVALDSGGKLLPWPMPDDTGYSYSAYFLAGVPYPSANPGSARYTGWSRHGEDFVEPHVVGEGGYGYLRLYEMTGKMKYLVAAIRCAGCSGKELYCW